MSNNDPRRSIIIYDIETYKNLFFVGTIEYIRDDSESPYVEVDGSEYIWLIDDYKEFYDYCESKKDSLWVGYNNYRFDDLVLTLFKNSNGELTDRDMRQVSDWIIKGGVPRSPNPKFKIGDMFFSMKGELKISGENRAKFWQPKICDMMALTGKGSLKMKAIILEAENIMESPISFDEEVPEDRKDEVFSYVRMDLEQTYLIYSKSESLLSMRDVFYKELPSIAYSANTPKLADEYFKLHTKSNEAQRPKYSNTRFRLAELCCNKNISFTNPKLKLWWRRFQKAHVHIPSSHLMDARAKIDDEELSSIDLGIYNHQITFGLGGLHSTNKNASWIRSENEIMEEADCTSMYPTSVINYSINPKHIPGYSKFVAGLVDKRNSYKQLAIETPDNKHFPILSDSYKLLNNSIFGKLADKFSYVSDTKAMYKVTITNQVLLLKLIDMMIESGIPYDLIQVNTDAVVYKYPKEYEEQWNAMLSEWEELSMHSLGHTYYDALYQESVNNYFAVKSGGGIKAKGNYVLKPRLDQKIPTAKITRLAVMKYLIDGIDPMETIRSSENIMDYMMSLNSTDFEQNGEALGYKAIRVVFDNNGSPITALKNDNICGGYKRSICVENEDLTFVKVLSDTENIDLNYDRYCWDAWVSIYKFVKPRFDNDGLYFVPKKNESMSWKHLKLGIDTFAKTDLIAQWYEYLTSLGLSVIPKSICKANYKGIRTKDKSTWNVVDPRNALGLGIVTDTCCVIDIDKPEALDPDLQLLLEKYPTMKVWHGEDRVLEGGKGSFVFRTDGSELLRNSSNMVDSHGFEFFNEENKVSMIMGVHDKCELYYIDGDMIDLPEEILEYLRNIKVDKKRAIPRISPGKRRDLKLKKRVRVIDQDKLIESLAAEGITVRDYRVEDEGASIHLWDTEDHWFVCSMDSTTGKYRFSTNQSKFAGFLSSLDLFQ